MAYWAPVGELTRSASVTLSGAGAGFVMFSVPSSNHKWVVKAIVCSTNQGSEVPYPDVSAHETSDWVHPGQHPAVTHGRSWMGQQQTLEGHIEMDDGKDLVVQFGRENPGVPGSVATARLSGQTYQWVGE